MADFTWPVSRSGYLWGKVYLKRTVALGLVTPDTGKGTHDYRPMDECPNLFLEFAQLGPTDREHLGFAAKYGQLTRHVTVLQAGDFGDEWRDVCRHTVRCVELGRRAGRPAAPRSSPPHLSDVLASPNGVNDAPKFKTKIVPSAEVELRAEWVKHVHEMKDALAEWIGENRTTDPAKLTRLRRRIEAILTGRLGLAFDPGTGRPYHVPTDLLSALWLQFGNAIGGTTPFKACKQCSKLFAVSVVALDAGGDKRRSREDKIYCCDRCQYDAAYALKKEKRQREAADKAALRGRTETGGPRRTKS